MYDRTSLAQEIADAMDRSPRGEITIRWRTQAGRRIVEFVRVADWDLDPVGERTGEQTGLPIEANADQVRLSKNAARNAEAIAVYRRSVAEGKPLTSYELAKRFGMSKTWGHSRMLEAR
ncbi:hypothetical protein [Actinomadura madurae]|uniref:hypothetical protein n=1 Tax=Actinomadura madurae TaxID=1993 RepID=UPI0020D24D4B|nr:hypothetical protein [Actinomadura madurae]MCQ0012749.1 hypothetical protein [Actinomadura madurae]